MDMPQHHAVTVAVGMANTHKQTNLLGLSNNHQTENKMKRLAPIALGLLAITACGSKTYYVTATDAPTTTTKVVKTTDAPIATSAPWSVEDEFIFDINEGYDRPIYLEDQDMIDAGYATCESLIAGSTAYDVITSINSSADGDPDIELLLSAVVASAVINFCPEQEWKFNN